MYRNIIEQADVVIFDLDGTLYEGKGHFKLHTENLKSRVREDLQEAFQEKYDQYENGESPLQIGKIYDGERDLIWSWDPFQETLTEARNWENEIVEVETHLLICKRVTLTLTNGCQLVMVGGHLMPLHVILALL